MIPEERYDRMVQSYDNALQELQETQEELKLYLEKERLERMSGYHKMAYDVLMTATKKQAESICFFLWGYLNYV